MSVHGAALIAVEIGQKQTFHEPPRSAAPVPPVVARCGSHTLKAHNGAGRLPGEDRVGEEENNTVASIVFHLPSKTSYAYRLIEEGG